MLTIKMLCPVSEQEETQIVIEELEDRIILKCWRCLKQHIHPRIKE
jgi:hypothetical protein